MTLIVLAAAGCGRRAPGPAIYVAKDASGLNRSRRPSAGAISIVTTGRASPAAKIGSLDRPEKARDHPRPKAGVLRGRRLRRRNLATRSGLAPDEYVAEDHPP